MPRIDTTFTVANFIQIGLIVLGGAAMWFTLVGSVTRTTDDIAALKPAVATLQDGYSTFNTRLTVVESRAETQSKAMDKLSESFDQLGTTVQGLAITSASVKTDVGYIRDFVEQEKRTAQGLK